MWGVCWNHGGVGQGERKLIHQGQSESSASVWELGRNVNITMIGTILGYLEE